LDNPTIGIRIANGTYFPIIKEDDRAKKKVVLSPVKENQKDVKIDIFRGEGETMYDSVYVASLILNNINQEDGKVPDIELLLSVSDDGILDVHAFEPVSGVKQFLSVSLDSIDSNIGFYDMQDSPSEDGISVDETSFSSDFDDNSGMDENEGSGDEKSSEYDKGHVEEEEKYSYEVENEDTKRKGSKKIVIILIILLLLLLGFLAYTLIMKPALAKNSEKANTPVAVVPALKEMQEVKPPVVEPTPVAVPEPIPVKEPEPIKPVEPEKKAEDTKYIIKWGDTLWDISNTYYRTPWLYKKIAKDNNIRNPDRIYAGNPLTIKAE